jgi:hypothetical protein
VWIACVVQAAACGRVGFDASGRDDRRRNVVTTAASIWCSFRRAPSGEEVDRVLDARKRRLRYSERLVPSLSVCSVGALLYAGVVRVIAFIILAACGRIGFDSITGSITDAPIPPPDTIVSDGLIAWYTFDDDEADQFLVTDDSGHGHGAFCTDFVNCPTADVGHAGMGRRFDGILNLLYVQSQPELEQIGAFTIATWLLVDVAPSGQSCAVNKPINGNFADSWQLCLTSALQIYFGTGATMGDIFSSEVATTGAWHHVAGVYDGAGAELWLDGMRVGSVATTSADPFDNEPIRIGADHDPIGDVSYFAGVLEEIRFYARPLTAQQIALLAGS